MIVKRATNIFLILCVIFIGACIYLLVTPAGLQWSYRLAQQTLPGKLKIDNLSGTLLGPIHFDHLTYYTNTLRVDVEQGSINWTLSKHISSPFAIKIHAPQLNIHYTSSESTTALSPPALPINFSFSEISFDQISYHQDEQQPILFNQVFLRGYLQKPGLIIEQFNFQHGDRNVEIQGNLRPFPFKANFEVFSSQDSYPDITANIELEAADNQMTIITEIISPFQATINGNFDFLQGDKPWKLDSDIKVHSPLLINGNLQVSGHKTDYSASAKINSEETFIVLKSKGEKVSGIWQFSVDTIWQNVIWPLLGETKYKSKEGNLSIQGNLNKYRFLLKTNLSGDNLPTSQWQLNGTGNTNTLSLKKIDIDILNGTVSGNGTLNFSPNYRWQIDLQAKQIDFSKKWIDFPSKLNFNLHTRGDIFDNHVNTFNRIDHIYGSWNHQATSGYINLQTKDLAVQSTDIDLTIKDAVIKIKGILSPSYALTWNIKIPDAHRIIELNNFGSISTTGELLGDLITPRLSLSLNAKHLIIGRQKVDSVVANGNLDFTGKTHSAFSLAARNIIYNNYSTDQLDINVNGAPQQHTINIATKIKQNPLALSLQGKYNPQNRIWQGELTQLNLSFPNQNIWALKNVVKLFLSADKINVDGFCWLAQAQKICTNLHWQKSGPWQNNLSIENFDLKQLNFLFNLPVEFDAPFNAEANLNSTPKQGMQGSLTAKIGQGKLLSNKEGVQKQVDFVGGELNSKINQQGLFNTFNFAFDPQDYISLNANFPGYHGQAKMTTQQALQGKLELVSSHLHLLPLVFPNFTNTDGELRATANWSGTIETPKITGQLRLKNGRFSLPRTNTQVTDINVVANANNSQKITYTAQAILGNGKLALQGDTNFSGSDYLTNIKLKGTNLTLANKKDNQLIVSPDLTIQLHRQFFQVDGKIFIPHAVVSYHNYVNAVNLPPETVFINDDSNTQQERLLKYFYANINLQLGDDVNFQLGDIKGKIGGALTITDSPETPTNATGELKIIDGTYSAFNQIFKIQGGSLFFAGGPLDNPGLNIRATKEVTAIVSPTFATSGTTTTPHPIQSITQEKTILVGVHITGALKTPIIKLFSEPAGLSDADILSYLVLGYPAHQAANNHSTQALWQALGALQIGGANVGTLKQHLQNLTGLDEISIESNAYLDPNTLQTGTNTAVVLGKMLSPRLFVGFSIGLLAPINTLTVRYKLTNSINIKTQSNTMGSGGDIIYTFETN